MSTRRRKQHQELVFREQWVTTWRRTVQALYDTQKGPWAPGPWWPEGSEKHVPGEQWLREQRMIQVISGQPIELPCDYRCPECHGALTGEVLSYDPETRMPTSVDTYVECGRDCPPTLAWERMQGLAFRWIQANVRVKKA